MAKDTDVKFDVLDFQGESVCEKFSQKGAWPGSRDPLNIWALNADLSFWSRMLT